MNVTTAKRRRPSSIVNAAKNLRVLSWNIRSLRSDRSAVIEVLQRFSPDVALLQETPRFLRARSKLAALARESGLVVAQGTGVEVAVLSSLRMNVHGGATVRLSGTPRQHRRWVALSSMSLGERRLVTVSVHLGLDAVERRQHATQIRSAIQAMSVPDAVIGADLNETDDGQAWQILSAGLSDPASKRQTPTFPADRPQKRIDAILLPGTWQTRLVPSDEVDGDALVLRASDHRPVVVDVMG